MRTLTRRELTAALAVRQGLVEPLDVPAAVALRRLTPLQAQHPPAPYAALAARVEGFSRGALEAAIDAGEAVKSTLMRATLHLAAADDYPAYAALWRSVRMRSLARSHPQLDLERTEAELRDWLAERPRTNGEIREHVERLIGAGRGPWTTVLFARQLLPLVQLPPAGHWRGPRQPLFAVDPRPLPDPHDAAATVLERYLGSFGPAARKDVATWFGAAQADFRAALERVPTVSHRDEQGRELLDLPGAPLPPADLELPPRFLSRWDQALLAYDDRERIMPAELRPLRLTLSGDQTVTVDGRVAATWQIAPTGRIAVEPLVRIPRATRGRIQAEAERMESVLELSPRRRAPRRARP